jgi:hypothetical protein
VPCQSICFNDCRQILTSFFHLFIGLLSILCVLVTDGRFSLFSIHPSSMAVFCCPNICMDTICLAHRWLSQSQCVWTHFVCNHVIFFWAERGICLPTICLWVLFIYVEASIRLKDLKHFPAHLDLCRPFAAHCIGYPVVTWGFDIKGYISYRIRQVILDCFYLWLLLLYSWSPLNNEISFLISA